MAVALDAKVCEWCRESFVPSRVVRRFCSRSCAKRSNKPPSSARTLAIEEASWLAALVDGEGSIVLTHPERPWPGVRLQVVNSHRGLLERVREVTGVGTIYAGNRAETWMVFGDSARALIRQIMPWLIVKSDRAYDALARTAQPDPELRGR